mmetsp:Transcript_98248/g.311677  ORF Transcript_98248/g.311677 Transcript_98248/m.311677 type:complete len:476 (-) Transcript_98248:50-1477(-)
MVFFLLVPGALHGSGHFERLAALLRSDGRHEAAAVELPGLVEDHSDPLLATFNAHVAAILSAVDSASSPVVLFGHSTAGCLITAAAEQRSEKIQKLIFLAAETLPGAFSFALDPLAEWAVEGIFAFKSEGKLMAVADGKAERAGEILFSDASDAEREEAVRLLRPSPMVSEEAVANLSLDRYWNIPKAYIKCTQDRAMLPEHQDTMHSRLREGSLRFELASGHGPFVSCPEKLAGLLLEIADMPAVRFRPMRQLCEAAWEERDGQGIRLEVLGPAAAPGTQAPKVVQAPEAEQAAAEAPPPKRPHVPPPAAAGGVVAYRISKSRRDSTLAKVLKFPSGVAVGAPVFYWYESFVDDPAQYTNSRLNVPERGHEASLDVAGVSRSLCAEGVVTWVECSRVACSWRRAVTKVPGEAWAKADDTSQVWGIDGREWNGSYTSSETGSFVENLAKYAKGSADAFWEDVPRKATALLESIEL